MIGQKIQAEKRFAVQQYLSIPHRSAPRDVPRQRPARPDPVALRIGLVERVLCGDWDRERVLPTCVSNKADPPRQVYFGKRPQAASMPTWPGCSTQASRQSENRAFKFSWAKACAALDEKMPPILGPLDMYHLHFYTGIYLKRHIPIHYEMLVGYDDKNAYVQDTGMENIQALPLNELRLAWDVNVTGPGQAKPPGSIRLPPSKSLRSRRSSSRLSPTNARRCCIHR